MSELVTDRKGQLMILVVMAMAFFLDGLDGTIVTIALPEIGKSFAMTTGESSWVITIYFMFMAGLILVFGKIGSKGAIKKILITGFLIFSASSLICGLSSSISVMLVARACQGIGSAMLAATGVMLAVKFFPINMRNFALSLTVLGSSLGIALGPVIGGFITQFFSWHWIFFINVPIGAICAYFTYRAVPKDGRYISGNFDYIGSIVLFVLLVCVIYSLTDIPAQGIRPLSGTALIASVVLLIVFIIVERRTEEPLLNLSIFRNLNFSGSAVVFILLNQVTMGAGYLFPFLMSIEFGFDTFKSGLLLFIPAATTLLLCIPIGKASDRYGTRVLATIAVSAMLGTMLSFIFIDSNTPLYLVCLALILDGAIWGVGGGSVGPRIIESVDENYSAMASALLSFFVYFGGALGTASFSAFFNIGCGEPNCIISELPPDIFMKGFVFSMIVAVIISAISLVITVAVRTKRN